MFLDTNTAVYRLSIGRLAIILSDCQISFGDTCRQTLPQIDRSVVSNIDQLVLSCEELLQKEQHAWRSTSQAARMMRQATEKEDDSKEV